MNHAQDCRGGSASKSKTSHQHHHHPSKRARRLSNDDPTSLPKGSGKAPTFRNVSACYRCRTRKHKCDQEVPRCENCRKAGAQCTSFDSLLNKKVPRSYVYYLERRHAYLEQVLRKHEIEFAPAEDLSICDGADEDENEASEKAKTQVNGHVKAEEEQENVSPVKQEEDAERLETLISNIGMVSLQGTSDSRYLGSTSGISFARVVFAAVRQSVSGAVASSDPETSRPSTKDSSKSTNAGDGAMRGASFGLHTKPTFKQAPFPSRHLATKLVKLYFEYANPQIPILHRGEFMSLVEGIYEPKQPPTHRELYMLNIVCAIGAGIILRDGSDVAAATAPNGSKREQQYQPEEYYASAVVHLESFLTSNSASDRPDGFGGGLEELQAWLLLAGFALLRPVAPGLWHIVGIATRLGVDLGLHYEDGGLPDTQNVRQSRASHAAEKREDVESQQKEFQPGTVNQKEIGRRQWVRDMRRRLWWCVYTMDRLVSTSVGRPFGIPDEVITTEFPSLLDDAYITPRGFGKPDEGDDAPSYKHVSYHYFRLRLLQSEIMNVIQHQVAQQARMSKWRTLPALVQVHLPSPYMARFDSFRSWRKDIDRRLGEWKDAAPKQDQTGVQFLPAFLELNYWQAVIMLYRQSLSVPDSLSEQVDTPDEVSSPSLLDSDGQDEDENVFLRVAEAGQRVLKIYRRLHRLHLVNYTYLATHHLFMAGVSFLYAVWDSPHVRQNYTVDDIENNVFGAASVLSDLTEKCPPAEHCRDALQRMRKATVQMYLHSTKEGHNKHGRDSATDTEPSKPRRKRQARSTGTNKHDSGLGGLDIPPGVDSSLMNPPAENLSQFTDTNPSEAPFNVTDSTNTSPLDFNFGSDNYINGLPFDSGMALDSVLGEQAAMSTSGIDFGFGLGGFGGGGLGSHDWSQGLSSDIFDGLYFGSGSGNGFNDGFDDSRNDEMNE